MIRRSFTSYSPFQPSLLSMIFSYIVLGIWSLFVLFAIYWLVITAFKSPADVDNGARYIPFVDYQPTLDAWQYILYSNGDPTFALRPYVNSIVIGIFSSVLALILGASTSYALTRFTYRPKLGLIGLFAACVALAIVLMVFGVTWQIAILLGLAIYFLLALTIGRHFKRSLGNNDIAFWLVSQRMLPPIIVILPIYIMFQQFHLLNTHLGLIIAYTAANLPLAIWFLRDYFQTIPIELEESAFIDGATRYQVLWRIILPLSLPGLVATFLIVLVFAWNEYTLALFLTGADTQTMPLLVVAQNATRGPQWWNISVLVTMMIVPILILAIILERFIAKGILVGAVKG
jgi:multiple sugar transport system permease protein